MAIGRTPSKKSSRLFDASLKRSSTSSSKPRVSISAPLELVSTTNMISFTSPSLRQSASMSTLPSALPAPSLSRSSSSASSASSIRSTPSPASSGSNSPTLSATSHIPRHSGSIRRVQPFGLELAQVDELAEELGCFRDEEEEVMVSRGLRKFDASDYEQEIWEGVGNVFVDELPGGAGWI